jgi:predicted SnoaL-like aldol condensation-catalyzing enzyme
MKNNVEKEKQRITAITITQLKEMATTKKLRDILKTYIEHEKITSVRTAWIEYFLDLKKT